MHRRRVPRCQSDGKGRLAAGVETIDQGRAHLTFETDGTEADGGRSLRRFAEFEDDVEAARGHEQVERVRASAEFWALNVSDERNGTFASATPEHDGQRQDQYGSGASKHGGQDSIPPLPDELALGRGNGLWSSPMLGRGRLVALCLLTACAGERTLSAPRHASPFAGTGGAFAQAEEARAPAPPPPASVSGALLPAQAPGSLPLAATPDSVPVVLEAAAPDGSWTVVCEARDDTDGSGSLEVTLGPRGELRGDRLERFLALPTGQIEAIDEFVTASEDGRFVVIWRAGRAELVDTKTIDASYSAFSELRGLDARRERTLPARSRVRAGASSLFFVRRHGSRSEIVERALASGGERVIYSGAHEIYGLDLDAAGAHVVVEVPGADSNGNGRIDHPELTEEPRGCSGPMPEVRARRSSIDASGFLLIPLAGGKPRRVDDLALVAGRHLIRRRADGAVLIERGRRAYVLGTDLCQGRVLFAEPERDLLLLGCAMPKKPWRFSVELWTGLTRRPLPIDVAALAVDEPVRPRARLFALYPGADTVLFDARRQTLLTLERGDLVLGIEGDHALIRRGRTALIYDANSEQTRALPGRLDPYGEALQTGPMIHASPFVVDLGAGRWVGNVSGRPLALSTSGAVLLPALPATAEAPARGPLLWRSPEPAP